MHDHTMPPILALHLPGAGQMVWRDKLSQLLESTGEGIFGIDMFGCCTFVHRAGAELLGWLPAGCWAKTCMRWRTTPMQTAHSAANTTPSTSAALTANFSGAKTARVCG